MLLKIKCFGCKKFYKEDNLIRTDTRYFDVLVQKSKTIMYCPDCYAYLLEREGESYMNDEGMEEYNYHLTKKDNYCPECKQLVDEYCFGMECSECHIIKTRLEDMC